jgi:RNA polymerase sigma-70 factor, ECF subfamily
VPRNVTAAARCGRPQRIAGASSLLIAAAAKGRATRASGRGMKLADTSPSTPFLRRNELHDMINTCQTNMLFATRRPGGTTLRGVVDERSPATDAGAAFTLLFESLRPELVRFAQWLTRDRGTAEDIVQEALLRAWRSRGALKDRRAARAWLFTIVRREHARLYERKRLEVVPLDEGAASSFSDEPEGFLSVHQALTQLPIESREPLVMQVLGGFSTREIAIEMGLTCTAVLTRLCRARKKVRALCGQIDKKGSRVRGRCPSGLLAEA